MNKELFLKALSTLFFSWGSDAPPEAYWAANEFLDYFEAVNGVKLDVRFDEAYDGNNYQDNYEEVIEKIKQI